MESDVFVESSSSTSNRKRKYLEEPALRGTTAADMSSVDLTTIDKGCKPFWNRSVKIWSERLPSCAKTALADTKSEDWNGALKRLTQNSWFTVTQKTQASAPSRDFRSRFFWQDITDGVARKIASEDRRKQEAKEEKKRTAEEKERNLSREEKEQTKRRKLEQEEQRAIKKQEREERRAEVERERLSTGAARKGKPPTPKKQKTDAEKEEKKGKAKPEQNGNDRVWKARRIRLYPTAQQKQVLRKWLSGARWCYNQSLERYRKHGSEALDLSYLRQTVVNDGLHKGNPTTRWLLDVPTEVRTEAVRDFVKAAKINEKKNRQDPEFQFEMKFQSVKMGSQSIVISKKSRRKEKELLSEMQAEVALPKTWKHDMRLVSKKNGKFYLCVPNAARPYGLEAAPRYTNPDEGVIALDPGVRTFMTGFDAMGNGYEWGKNDVSRLCRLRAHHDKLRRLMSGVNHAKRYRMRKALSRLQEKMSNLVDDLHHKLAKWLCETYRVIFLPKFEIRDMVKKKGGRRKISKRNVRSLYALKHYTFRQRLLNKAREYPWVKVCVCNEACTTMTCSHCGALNKTIGASKTFSCAKCKVESDRDLNGSRNILLRQLGLLG